MSTKENNKPVQITELVLRDGHQSLFATRMRIDDMLPIAEKLDQIGYWSMESWGGATFDACIRFLGEDPWERIREIKKVMPNTPQQMLLRDLYLGLMTKKRLFKSVLIIMTERHLDLIMNQCMNFMRLTRFFIIWLMIKIVNFNLC